MFVHSFMKICLVVQKLLLGQWDTQHCCDYDINLYFVINTESRPQNDAILFSSF
jgi:hypothetical protein